MPTKKNKNITRIVNRVNKSSADFVNRLKDPNRISIPDWEDSRYVATHKLGVGTDNNGQVFIYPSVQNINGKLVDFTNPKFGKWDGMDSAIERGDTVHVDNIQDGLDFTENYKRYYPTGKTFKCGGRRKARLGLDIREGGIAIPIANNMWYIHGRKHETGGVTMGPNNKNGVEVEGGEVVEMIDSNHPSVGRQFAAGGQNQTMRVFSSVPLLRGVSPAQLVMGGANPNKVFKAQEEFKDRNRINDDGTMYKTGGEKKSNSAIRTEDDKKVSAYNRALYSLVDPTMGYPTKKEAVGYAIGAGIKTMRNPNDMVYWVEDSVSDAGWRKRLGLSYNDKFLIPNEDGSVRLPKDREMEIPTDTIMLKNRIAANKKLAKRYPEGSEKRDIVDWALKVDGMALDSLRHTYRTGEPVTINEGAYNSRRLINNGELNYPGIMPHNVMQNYAIQYDKSKDRMNYWDTYNFNEFEWGVPGKPFEIKGNIPLKKAGGIYIKPSKRGTFTAAATKHGIGVQEFASKVLANKEDYSQAMVKKANFARNASRWKKEFGGSMIYTINGNVKNGLMSARPKAQYGKQTIIRNNKEWEYDEKSGAFVPVKDVTKYKTIAGKTYKKEPNSKNYVEVTDSIEKIKVNQPKKQIVKQNKNSINKLTPINENKYTSVTKSNTGESYRINPLTGEWIRNDITETSEPSVKGTTKVSVQSNSTPRKGETKPTTISRGTAKVESPKPATVTNPMEARYASRVQKGQAQEVTTQPVVEYNETADKNPNKYRYTRATNFGKPSDVPTKPGNTVTNDKDEDKVKNTPWIGQYKPVRTEDWIGSGANVAGSIASYLLTKRGIDKMPKPVKPIMAQAAKLKTRYDIEAPLSEISQGTQLLRALIRRNTQSSNTSLAREQRAMNEAQESRNRLYGQKENVETQWINQDRLNRQSVMRDNIRTHNEYLNRLTATKMAQNEMRASNINNLISGLTGSVSNILGTIESRRATNNTLRAIAAANPNVDARLIGGFDYYIDPITKKKYNKNQQYVGTINS